MTGPAGMEAVILCGGLGTRLREETEFKPKPMVEIGGRPILWHIMKHYRRFGVRDFVLCLGYRGNAIRDYFLSYTNHVHDCRVDLATGAVTPVSNGEDIDWRVTLAETGPTTQTGARLIRALRHVRGDRFFATYGDGVSDVDLDSLLDHHTAIGKPATVTAVHPSSRFGELSIEGEVVHSFAEKPQVTGDWINGGFFVFEKRAFDGFAADNGLTLEDGILDVLARRKALAVHRHGGFWQCMDTQREMTLLNEMWADGRARWKTWTD